MQAATLIPAVLTALAALGIALVPYGWPAPGRVLFERGLADAGLIVLVAVKLDESVRAHSVVVGLPLQVCDVSSIACAVALVRGGGLARSIALYFGLGLSSFALLFPDLGAGPASAEYWLFWIRHGLILASALYDLVVRGFRPRWVDYAHWCAFGAAYIAVVVGVNMVLGTNFAFIADRTLEHTRIVDAFGRWPGRAMAMLALSFVHAAAITVLIQALPPLGRIDVDKPRAAAG
jgi:hypothetical integral membrane protein (TIGR02206 family)